MNHSTKMAADNNSVNKEKPCISLRYVEALMLFFGLMLTYSMRVNISVAIVAMTNDLHQDGSKLLDWDVRSKTIVLSSFMLGNVVTQIPGHQLASKYGGKLLISTGIGLNAVMSAILPLGAYNGGYKFVCGCRVIQGLAQGAIMPAIHSLIQNWAPSEEKYAWECLMASGTQLGTAAEFLISAFAINKFGWETVFYMNFISGAIWTIVYLIIGSNSPQTSKIINETEKEYLKRTIEPNSGEQVISGTSEKWVSLPFVSLIVANCAQNWGLWVFSTLIPLYLYDIHETHIVKVGLISASPFIGLLLMKFPFGYISNAFVKSNCVRITIIRKIFNSIGFLGPASLFLILSYNNTFSNNIASTATLLALILSFNAAHSYGFMSVHNDLAPNLSGHLKRVTNNFADVLSIFAPLTAGAMILDETDPNQWRYVFNLCATLYIACNMFFVIFGTSDKQQWNNPHPDTKAEATRQDIA